MTHTKKHLDEQSVLASEMSDLGNYAQSFKLFLALAENGDASSMNRVGVMYDDGSGVERDFDKAVFWLKEAMKYGETSAYLNLGITYRNHGHLRDARCWFECGLDKGDSENALELAKLYFVSDKELKTVEKYLKIALADENLTEASKEEAMMLIDELGKLQSA